MKIPLNTIIGEYRILNLVGIGGMGEVYRVVHNNINQIFAIKVLSKSSANTKATDRFINEARIHASLRHPNIATFFEFVEFKDFLCIIMEYVDGQLLEERIKSCKSLPLDEVITIFQSVVEAVAYLHHHGIVHRDIKSNNIKISSTKRVKLLDFGIAKDTDTPRFTEINSCIGTLSYLAPEQILGKHADTRSDVWSLGILLYEMVTSNLPFEATSIGDIYAKIIKEKYKEPSIANPVIPRRLKKIIARCLEKKPDKRYQTARELLDDIQEIFFELTEPPCNISNIPSRLSKIKWQDLSLLIKNYWPFVFSVSSIIILIIISINSNNGSHVSTLPVKPKPDISPPPLILSEPVSKKIVPLKIDTQDGKAEVWLKSNGSEKKVGVTPYSDYYPVGETITIILRRPGYANKEIPITISPVDNDFPFNSLDKKR